VCSGATTRPGRSARSRRILALSVRIRVPLSQSSRPALPGSAASAIAVMTDHKQFPVPRLGATSRESLVAPRFERDSACQASRLPALVADQLSFRKAMELGVSGFTTYVSGDMSLMSRDIGLTRLGCGLGMALCE